MADSTSSLIDNQFEANGPKRPMPVIRPDYWETSRPTNTYDQPVLDLPIKKHGSHLPLIPRGFFDSVLKAPFVPEKPRHLKLDKKRYAIYSLAVFVLLGGAYLSYLGWQSTNVPKKQATSLTKITSQAYVSGLGVSPKSVLKD